MIEATIYQQAYVKCMEVLATNKEGYTLGEWRIITIPGVLGAFERSCGPEAIERIILRWQGKVSVFRLQALTGEMGQRYAKQDYELGFVSYRDDGKAKDSITPRVLCPEQAEAILGEFIQTLCNHENVAS